MSAETASLDRVRDAAESLRRRGVSPTADRIVELVGGSKTTVLGHLKTLRSAPALAEEVPPSVIDLIRPALAQIYRQGREAESEKTRAATEVLSRTVEELDAQISELADQNGRLEQATRRQSEDLQKAATELERLVSALSKSEAEKEEMRARTKAEEIAVEGRLSHALSKIETLLSDKATPERKTITMPGGQTRKS